MSDHHGDTVSMDDLTRESHGHNGPRFIQTNLISDGSVPAMVIDPSLINPWGLAETASSPFWINENGSGQATIDAVTGHGHNVNVAISPASPITIPAPMAGDTSAPTGIVSNSFTDSFKLADGKAAVFLFATEDGTIAGWNPADGKTAELKVNNSTNTDEGDTTLGVGAVYKGLAIGASSSGPTLYAANFSHGTVDMFDQNFNQTGSFTDPTVPSGFAPFNVQVLDGKLYVTYAMQDDMKHDDVAGMGNGFVDAFDLDGNMLGRVASGGALDSPWGLAIAPNSFGKFAGDLLVGNFGDGHINVFDQDTGGIDGQLKGSDGQPIAIPDLWALSPGNGGNGGSTNKIYFTAGLQDEAQGLFGSLSLGHG